MAKGVATVLVFKSRINGDAVEVDRTRVKILDAGEWSLVFELLVEPGPDERLPLSVPFVDGNAAARAVFALVSSASEVDTRLDVARREPTLDACQEALAEAQARCAKSRPIRFLRDGWLKGGGVVAHQLDKCAVAPRRLSCRRGTAYRAGSWALVDVTFVNGESSQPPWVPREVILRAKSGAPLKLLAVEWDTLRIPPGATGRVFIEAEPPMGQETVFILEVRDAAGRGLTIDEVDLSMQERKP